MREIKFRAIKRNSCGKTWLFSQGYYFDGLNYWFTIPNKNPAIGYAKQLIIVIKSLGQFTGLKDKNGKDIYEGDIVNADSNSNSGSCHPTQGIGVVTFKKELASFIIIIKNNPNFILKLFHICTYLEGLNIDVEVIGNIYENPNLLEPKTEVSK